MTFSRTTKQDEIWHFHTGGTLLLHSISPSGQYDKQLLGVNLDNGSFPQVVIKAGLFFSAEIHEGEFTLMSCTVAPGFDFADFEMPNRRTMLELFPEHSGLICSLTHD